jgi:hypothetical protein
VWRSYGYDRSERDPLLIALQIGSAAFGNYCPWARRVDPFLLVAHVIASRTHSVTGILIGLTDKVF